MKRLYQRIDAMIGRVVDSEVSLANGGTSLDLQSSIRDDAAKLQYLQAYAKQCAWLAAQNEQVNMHPR